MTLVTEKHNKPLFIYVTFGYNVDTMNWFFERKYYTIPTSVSDLTSSTVLVKLLKDNWSTANGMTYQNYGYT